MISSLKIEGAQNEKKKRKSSRAKYRDYARTL